ncbi:MAG: PD-(D/E)XK nuclease family protein [Clostridiales Family XIII bacterium]|jgi:ATP-dependent helicase/nuclease subunit B|nr:PD-(D/E)XK nuclease family protein [Clostridiales Family XIII bacterium]
MSDAPLTICCGRESADREAFMFARIGESLDALRLAGDARGRILLIVPDQFTLQAERDAFAYLRLGGFMELEIVTFSRLMKKVLDETGGDRRIPVSRNGRHMLLSLVLRRLGPQLEAFSDSCGRKGFVEMANELISEMKLHNVSPDDLRALLGEAKQPIMKRKLADALRIYEAYEALTREGYLDAEDHLGLFISRIQDSEAIRRSEIWVYGFDCLSPKDIDIVGGLLGQARSVSVAVTAEGPDGGREGGRDKDVFRITGRLVRDLREKARGLGRGCRVLGVDAPAGAARSPAAAHIESELFSYPYAAYGGGRADDLTLLAAASPYAEAESAAIAILRLVRDEGFRFRDILVICNDMEARGAIIRRVFSEYGLPVFMDRRRPLMHNPVLEYITALMDAVAEGWRTDDIVRLMKTGMSPVSHEQCEMLDEYAFERRLRGKGAWTRPFSRPGPYERDGAEAARRLELLNEARSLIAGHIAKFSEAVGGERGLVGRTRALYLFLRDEARLPERLAGHVGRLREEGRHAYADELSQVWSQVIGVFDQMEAILGDEPLSRSDYAALLSAGLETIEIGLLPTNTDQLMVGTMRRTRPGSVRALFVLGANDGELPAAASREGFFSDEEKALMFRSGHEIGKLDALVAEEERLAIYRNLSRAEQRLWVSHSVSGPDGGELRPSTVFGKLARIFPQNPVEKDVRSAGGGMGLVGTKESTLAHLASALRGAADGRPAPGPWRQVEGWFRANAPGMLEPVDRALAFSDRRDAIAREYVGRLYGAEGGAIRLSPSGLERYARCPFSHFVAYGLRPKERRASEAGARERGDILHRAMLDFSKILTEGGARPCDEGSGWMRLAREDCDRIVDGIFLGLLEPDGGGAFADIFGQGGPELYRAGRICRLAKIAAWTAAEQVKAGAVEAMRFEERFGDGQFFPAIRRITADGQEIRIEGQIDRVDVIRGGRVKIIDYKTGGDSFSAEEAKEGWKLQLMLYLDAATGGGDALKPAGAFYFRISEPRFDCSAWDGDDPGAAGGRLERERRRSFRLDGVAVDDQDALKAIAGDSLEGGHYGARGVSDIMQVRATADAGTGGLRILSSSPASQRLLDEAAFAELRAAVGRRVSELCENLAGGVIDAEPRGAGNLDACRYCGYGAICGRG